jgi:hypothetical protein
LESVATRTPPPICTSAPGFQTALIWRTVGAANGYKEYTMRDFPQCLDSRREALQPIRAPRCSCEATKQVFESPRRFVRADRCHKSRRACENF